MPPDTSLEAFKTELTRLVGSFQRNLSHYKTEGYDESSLRNDFLNPFWRALGWDIENRLQATQPLREVQIESRVDIAGRKKKADYLFRTDGIDRFVCEAKKPREELSKKNAYQAQRYAFNLKLLTATLTNFETFQIFIVGGKPDQAAPWESCKNWHFTDYVEKAEEIWTLFSRTNVSSGSLDKFIAALPKRTIRGKVRQGWLIAPDRARTVDADFLAYIEEQREELARDLVRNNPRFRWTPDLFNECIQRILDRLLFVRICEDRDIDTGRSLELIVREWESLSGGRPSLYSRLIAHFNSLDLTFNGALFRKGHESETLQLSDQFLVDLIQDLSSEDSPYLFSTLPVEILGSVYEQFIGKVVRLTSQGKVKVELKPEVRKAGGVYYTPRFIVDYIVEQTVGRLLDGKSPKDVANFKFLDPACGSGSFLIRVFERVCEHHVQWLQANPSQQQKQYCYRDKQDTLHLTTHFKRQIMLNNIFGIDLDFRAIEVTMLSLYLKILEGETRSTLGQQQGLFPKETFLPDLSANIKCGNSLVSGETLDEQLSLLGDHVRLDLFDWDSEFPQVGRKGGFDAIIGNPPYGAELSTEDAAYLRQTFKTGTKDLDTYALFIEQAINKSRSSTGLVSMIVPTGWYSGPKFNKLRRFVATHTDPILFVNLPYDIFSAWVDTSVFVVRKRKTPTTWPRSEPCPVSIRTFPKRHRITAQSEFQEGLTRAELTGWFDGGADEFLTYADASDTRLLKKITLGDHVKPLGEIADVQRGVTPFNTSPRKNLPNARPAFCGTVRRYKFDRGAKAFIRFDETLAELKPKRYFEGPRVLLREMISRQFRLQATKVEEDFVTNKSMQSILLRDGSPDLAYILGCLNSRLMSWYFLHKSNVAQRDDFPKIVLKETRGLPIPALTHENKASAQRLSKLVERFLQLSKKVPNARGENESTALHRQLVSIDRQIDQLVYELYGLTSQEIELIESPVMGE